MFKKWQRYRWRTPVAAVRLWRALIDYGAAVRDSRHPVMRCARKVIGSSRWYYGFCPACNSDAPAVDHCQTCNGLRNHAGMPAIQDLNAVWMRFKDSDFKLTR